MRPKESFPMRRQRGRDLSDRQSRSIGRENRMIAKMHHYPRKQRSFYFEIFSNRLHHPVTVCQPRQIILKVARQ